MQPNISTINPSPLDTFNSSPSRPINLLSSPAKLNSRAAIFADAGDSQFAMISLNIYGDADDTKPITSITNAKIIPVNAAAAAVSAACTAVDGPIDVVIPSDNATN
eukprot:150970_1